MQIGKKIYPTLSETLNPNESGSIFQSEWIRGRNYSDGEFRLNHSDLGFIWIKNFVRIYSDWIAAGLEVSNPNKSEVRMIYPEFSIRIIPTSDSFG